MADMLDLHNRVKAALGDLRGDLYFQSYADVQVNPGAVFVLVDPAGQFRATRSVTSEAIELALAAEVARLLLAGLEE